MIFDLYFRCRDDGFRDQVWGVGSDSWKRGIDADFTQQGEPSGTNKSKH